MRLKKVLPHTALVLSILVFVILILPMQVFAQLHPGVTPLSSGQTVTGSVGQLEARNYGIIIPSNATQLIVAMTGTGDADIYVNKNAPPTSSDWDAFLDQGGTNETITISSQGATTSRVKERLTPGAWYIMVIGFRLYTGRSSFTLKVEYVVDGTLSPTVTVTSPKSQSPRPTEEKSGR